MKNKIGIALIVTILFTSLSCNLSSYLSDTPPVDWVAPTDLPEITKNDIDLKDSCIPSNTLSSTYQEFSGSEINIENPYGYLNEIIGTIFQEAKLTQADSFISEENESIISCAVFSPLNAFEKITFDIMLKQPENLLPFIDAPDIEITQSRLVDQFQSIGDSFGMYHLDLYSDSSYSAEFLATRKEEFVFIFTYVYRNSNDNLSDFSNLINAIK